MQGLLYRSRTLHKTIMEKPMERKMDNYMIFEFMLGFTNIGCIVYCYVLVELPGPFRCRNDMFVERSVSLSKWYDMLALGSGFEISGAGCINGSVLACRVFEFRASEPHLKSQEQSTWNQGGQMTGVPQSKLRLSADSLHSPETEPKLNPNLRPPIESLLCASACENHGIQKSQEEHDPPSWRFPT